MRTKWTCDLLIFNHLPAGAEKEMKKQWVIEYLRPSRCLNIWNWLFSDYGFYDRFGRRIDGTRTFGMTIETRKGSKKLLIRAAQREAAGE